MPEKLRVVIADDEPLARQRIEDLLRKDDKIEIAGRASTGNEAVEIIRRRRPRLAGQLAGVGHHRTLLLTQARVVLAVDGVVGERYVQRLPTEQRPVRDRSIAAHEANRTLCGAPSESAR